MIYESPVSKTGEWDKFLVRHIGWAVQKNMAEEFSGDPGRTRQEAMASIARALDLDVPRPGTAEHASFENFALALSLISDLSNWRSKEKQQIVDAIAAKSVSGLDLPEMEYVRKLQRARRLREAWIRIGSQGSVQPNQM